MAQAPVPPPPPVLIYDGDCGFCRHWIQRFQRITGPRVDYLSRLDPTCATRFPHIPPTDLEEAVHLVEPGGRTCRGAEAVIRALATTPGARWTAWAYAHLPGLAPVAERVYAWVARHRSGLSQLQQRLYGAPDRPQGPPRG
jgi:predicted DCC family thiol-disulfide oxidoreductase YuxK